MCLGLDARVKKLNALDIVLIKLAVFFATIIIIKLFPQLFSLRLSRLLVLTLGCAIIPFYKFWIKKSA